MVSEEEVKQGLISAEDVGPPLAEDEHSEGTESSLDPDLVEDLIPDEDDEPSLVEEVTQPKVRPLDWRFFSSVRDYVKGLPSFRVDKPFFLRLSDPKNYEHKKSLFLWRVVSSIRLLILNPKRLRSILEEMKTYTASPKNERMTKHFEGKLAQVSEQERELSALLTETRWTEYFLDSVKGSNVLAQQIWHALRGVPTGLMEDVLEELRTRLKLGRIWENDPWWPNDR